MSVLVSNDERATAVGETPAARDGDGGEFVDCVVVIVAYNSALRIGALLDSLPAAAGNLSYRCIVVDNNSTDGTVALLRSRGDASIVEPGENLGYAGAINLGRALAGPCGSTLILNPDLVLEPEAIVRLQAALQDAAVGVGVPMLLNDDGSLYFTIRREPTPLRALGDALFGSRFPQRPAWLSETVRDRRVYEHQRDTAWAGGAAMLVSAECFDAVGDWDDGRFFLYAEETDFAARARRAGYAVRYVPAARAYHEDGGSGRPPALTALQAVNRIRYYEKYHGQPGASLFRAAITLQHLVRCHRPDERAALRAICHRSSWAALPGGRV
jgi:N-acetylglucosaminyl-diphospho-decaprenol L-rhamnosyltransferase